MPSSYLTQMLSFSPLMLTQFLILEEKFRKTFVRAGKIMSKALTAKAWELELPPCWTWYTRVVVWIKMTPIGLCIGVLGHQGVALFERIRRYSLIGGSMPLGMGFEVSKSPFQAQSFSLLLPVDLDVEFLATSLAPCLPGCYHSSLRDNGLNLWNCKPAPVKCFLL